MTLKEYISVTDHLPKNEASVDVVMSIDDKLFIFKDMYYSNRNFYNIILINDSVNRRNLSYNKVFSLEPDPYSMHKILWWYPAKTKTKNESN